ncbi:NAD(P)/FAD-dependent oxidoreductase [Halobaculum sp. MBLA0147]|uniref:NAD(P)/FAD-dependent oxidoreductase n=1 Tax=Halobaculum sp. MBLA0147 TaxID=3079934 RepID=UPI003525EFE2
MTRIGVIGAGAASAAAVFQLATSGVDAEVTVLEKSGGLCGRAATRRHEALTYDYGANYVKSADDRVVDLLTERLDDEGLVDASEPIYTFDAEGDVSPGRDADDHKWSYEAGLTQIAKRLFGRTDATVHRRTRVETIGHDAEAETWSLVDTDGDRHGPFDVLLANPPAPQTAELLETAEWDSPARERLVDAASDVSYRTIWTAVLHYEFPLDVPYYGLVDTTKEHAVGWISREECKAGHVPDGESLLIVQANHEWSVEHYDDDPDENVDRLADHAADIVGDDRLRDPDWTDNQGWRYALPEDELPTAAREAAEEEGLWVLGDWVGGEARLHTALRNGLETGDRLADRL